MTGKDEKTGVTGGHVDADKIGGVAQQNPDWGKQYPSDPARSGNKPSTATRGDRGGRPKSSPPKSS